MILAGYAHFCFFCFLHRCLQRNHHVSLCGAAGSDLLGSLTQSPGHPVTRSPGLRSVYLYLGCCTLRTRAVCRVQCIVCGRRTRTALFTEKVPITHSNVGRVPYVGRKSEKRAYVWDPAHRAAAARSSSSPERSHSQEPRGFTLQHSAPAACLLQGNDMASAITCRCWYCSPIAPLSTRRRDHAQLASCCVVIFIPWHEGRS